MYVDYRTDHQLGGMHIGVDGRVELLLREMIGGDFAPTAGHYIPSLRGPVMEYALEVTILSFYTSLRPVQQVAVRLYVRL